MAKRKLTQIDHDNVYALTLLTDRVKLPAQRLAPGYRAFVADVLRGKYYNVCSKFGYVRDGAVEIVDVKDPVVQLAHLNGDSIAEVTFRAWVCNPARGSLMRGVVQRINKFGAMVQAGPVQCVLTRSSVSDVLRNDIDDLNVGASVVVRLAGVRYEVMDTVITAVGTLDTEAALNEELDRVRAAIESGERPREASDTRVVSVEAGSEIGLSDDESSDADTQEDDVLVDPDDVEDDDNNDDLDEDETYEDDYSPEPDDAD